MRVERIHFDNFIFPVLTNSPIRKFKKKLNELHLLNKVYVLHLLTDDDQKMKM